jgi:hypothetical protein
LQLSDAVPKLGGEMRPQGDDAQIQLGIPREIVQ